MCTRQKPRRHEIVRWSSGWLVKNAVRSPANEGIRRSSRNGHASFDFGFLRAFDRCVARAPMARLPSSREILRKPEWLRPLPLSRDVTLRQDGYPGILRSFLCTCCNALAIVPKWVECAQFPLCGCSGSDSFIGSGGIRTHEE